MFAENRGVKCKSKKDFKSIDMFEMCIWTDKDTKVDGFVEKTKSCQIPNVNIFDESMFVGRIQINLNDGKKRKFLYFQADYRLKGLNENEGSGNQDGDPLNAQQQDGG